MDSRLYVVGAEGARMRARRLRHDVEHPPEQDLAARWALEMRRGVRDGYTSRLTTPESWVVLLTEYAGNVAKQVTNARLSPSRELALLHDAGVEACMLAAAAMEAARVLGVGERDGEGDAA